MMKKRQAEKQVYKESENMLKMPKNYKPSTENLPDMKKVEQYYSQMRVK